MRGRLGRGEAGRTYGRAVGLVIGALSIDAVITLLERARGATHENEIEEALETVKGRIKEVVTALREGEAKTPRGARTGRGHR